MTTLLPLVVATLMAITSATLIPLGSIPRTIVHADAWCVYYDDGLMSCAQGNLHPPLPTGVYNEFLTGTEYGESENFTTAVPLSRHPAGAEGLRWVETHNSGYMGDFGISLYRDADEKPVLFYTDNFASPASYKSFNLTLVSATEVHQIVAGKKFACVLASEAASPSKFVACVAPENEGIFTDTSTTVFKPQFDLESDEEVVQLEAGPQAMCIITNLGAAKCYGRDKNGALGTNKQIVDRDDFQGEPIPKSSRDKIVDLCLGFEYSCAIVAREDGEGNRKYVQCFGRNTGGVAAQNSTSQFWNKPSDVTQSGNFVDVGDREPAELVCGIYNNACVRFVDGGLACWGDNSNSQIDNTAEAPSAVSLPSFDVAFPSSGRANLKSLFMSSKLCAWFDDNNVYCRGGPETSDDDTPVVFGPHCDRAEFLCGLEFGKHYSYTEGACVNSEKGSDAIAQFANSAMCLRKRATVSFEDLRTVYRGFKASTVQWEITGDSSVLSPAMLQFYQLGIQNLFVTANKAKLANAATVNAPRFNQMYSTIDAFTFTSMANLPMSFTRAAINDVDVNDDGTVEEQRTLYGGYIPPFTYRMLASEDNRLAKLQYYVDRTNAIQTAITNAEGQVVSLAAVRSNFDNLFEGLKENAKVDTDQAVSRQSSLMNSINAVMLRGERNSKDLAALSKEALTAINAVVDKKDELVEALEELERAKAAAALFSAIIEAVAAVVVVAVAAVATFGASLPASAGLLAVQVGKFAVENLPEIVEAGEALWELGQSVGDMVDALDTEDAADYFNDIGADINLGSAKGSVNSLFKLVQQMSAKLALTSTVIVNSLANPMDSAALPNVNLGVSSNIWEAIHLEMLNALVNMDVCKTELLVGRRRRLEAAIASPSPGDLATAMALRRGNDGQVATDTRRALGPKEDKIKEKEEKVERIRGELDQKCVIFVNTFKQVSIFGKGLHNDMLEAAEALRSFRQATIEVEQAKQLIQSWEDVSTEAADASKTTAAKIALMKQKLEVERDVNDLILSEEFDNAMDRYSSLCAAVRYTNPVRSLDCDNGAKQFLDGAEFKYTDMLRAFESLQSDNREALLAYAAGGRNLDVQKVDVTKYVNMTEFRATGEARFALHPSDFAADKTSDLYCARNVEVSSVGLVAVGSATDTEIRFQTTVRGPYFKVVDSVEESGVAVEYAASLPTRLYNYEYATSEKCDDGDQLRVCDTNLCSSMEAAATAGLSLPPLYATYETVLSKGTSEDLKDVTRLFMVFESQVTIASADSCVQESTTPETCSWTPIESGNNGLSAGAVVGIVAGAALVTTGVAIGGKMTLAQMSRKNGEREKQHSFDVDASPKLVVKDDKDLGEPRSIASLVMGKPTIKSADAPLDF